MTRRLALSLFMSMVLVACGAGQGFHAAQDVKLVPVPGMRPLTTKPIITDIPTKTGNYKVVEGGIESGNLSLQFAGEVPQATLQGNITIHPYDGDADVTVPLQMDGLLDADHTAKLKPTNQAVLNQDQVTAGAKVTCLADDCSDSFVDIYIKYKGQIYHQQLESKSNPVNVPTAAAPGADAQNPAPAPEAPAADDDQAPVPAAPQPQQDPPPPPVAAAKAAAPTAPVTPAQKPAVQPQAKAAAPKPFPDQAPVIAGPTHTVAPAVPAPAPDPAPVAPTAPAVQPVPAAPAVAEDSISEEDLKENDGDDGAQPIGYVGTEADDLNYFFPSDSDKTTVPPVQEPPAPQAPAAPQAALTQPTLQAPPSKKVVDLKTTSAKPAPAPAPSQGTVIYNQAVHYVTKGWLESAVDFGAYEKAHPNSGFHVLNPQKKEDFGTNDMLAMVNLLGAYSLKNHEGYVLKVGPVAKQRGGPFGHLSHETGLDADIAYYFNDKSEQNSFTKAVSGNKVNSNWNLQAQWSLFKAAVATGNVDRFFVHPVLKKLFCQNAIANNEIQKSDKTGLVFETLRRLRPDVSHGNHFHMRLKCSSAQPRCWRMSDPADSTGCF